MTHGLPNDTGFLTAMQGTHKNFYSIDPLIQCIHKNINAYTVFSFDLFDTLLIRRIPDPDDVKNPVCRHISHRLQQKGIHNWSPERILRLRNRVEKLHRRRHARRGKDREANYNDFMHDVLQILLKTAFSDSFFKEIREVELQIEASILVPRQAFSDLLTELKKAGKQVLIISDMYLPASELQKILNRISFPHTYDAIISSADSLQAKTSGAAWPLIAKNHSINPKNWLHIGDNPNSDGKQPAAFGISSFVLRDIKETYRKRMLRISKTWAKHSVSGAGLYRQKLMRPLENETMIYRDFYKYGYTFIGFTLCAFVRDLMQQAIVNNLEHIYFFSREGRLLQEIWNNMKGVLYEPGKLPPTSYLRVSRHALAPAACAQTGLTHELVSIALRPPENDSFRDICRAFSLPLDPCGPLLTRYQFDADTPLKTKCQNHDVDPYNKLCSLLKDSEFQDIICRHCQPSHTALTRYLTDMKLFAHSRVGLVDIGWLGTMQSFLHKALLNNQNTPDFYGYLLAKTDGYSCFDKTQNRLQGYLLDGHDSLTGGLISFFKVQMEEATRGPEPSLRTYRCDGDSYALDFRTDTTYENELVQSKRTAPIRQGILDASKRFAICERVTPPQQLSTLKPWSRILLFSRIAFPSRSSKRLWSKLEHVNEMTNADNVNKLHSKHKHVWNSPDYPFGIRTIRHIYLFAKFSTYWLTNASRKKKL
ncbi:MAG: hypothetical protein EOL87_12530 [Spartobacteria bacterium]|nr:hypothetical protein [Spartobacteria bacterium]